MCPALYTSLFPKSCALGRKGLCGRHTSGVGECPSSWGAECLHKLLDLFCTGNLSLLPICLFSHLFILTWTCRYLFYTLGYNPILPCFVVCLFCFFSNCSTLATGTLSVGSHVPLTHPHHFLCIYFPNFWHEKILQAHPVCFLPWSQKQPFLQGAQFLGSEMVVETKGWVPGVLAAARCHCSWPPGDAARKRVQVYPWVSTYL